MVRKPITILLSWKTNASQWELCFLRGFSSICEGETFSLSSLITVMPVPHMKVCLSLTRQSVGLGPVQPAAQCSLQQSLGEGPLHLLEHCCAQFSFVTGDRNRTNLVKWQVICLWFWGDINYLCQCSNHGNSSGMCLPSFTLLLLSAKNVNNQ